MLVSPAGVKGQADVSALQEEARAGELPFMQGASAATGGGFSQSGLFRTLPKQGDQLVIGYQAPIFAGPVNAGKDVKRLDVIYKGQPGEKLTVASLSGEMMSVNSYDRGKIWIPLWYLTEASGQAKTTEPQFVTIRSGAKVSLTPSSQIRWDAGQASDGSRMVATAKWNGWYGVIVNPGVWHREYEVYRPVLVWVHEKDVTDTEPLSVPLLAQVSNLSLDSVRSIAELSLHQGDEASKVKALLGEPAFTETSEDLQTVAGDRMITGTAWRYERKDAQFTVSFSPEGKLERTHWIIPGGKDKYWKGIYSGDDYINTYDFTVTPLAKTLAAEPEWANKGTLAFTYLVGAGSDVLLLKGDDGGFSGMHHDSSLYGVDRKDGKTRWRLEAGYGSLNVAVEPSGLYALVFTSYNPEEEKYINQLRRIRLSDGKTMWEQRYGEELQIGMWSARDSVVTMTWKCDGTDNGVSEAELTVFDSETGRKRWSRPIREEAKVLNQGAADPYILIRDGGTLEALDPETGKKAWILEDDGMQVPDYSLMPYFAGGERVDPIQGPDPESRWILLGDTWRRLDLKTGTVLGEYPALSAERFEVLNERLLLVQHALDAGDFWGAERYESYLFDVSSGEKVWTLSGKVTNGVLDGETLYAAVNGIPAALDFQTGKKLWQMPSGTGEDADLSAHAAGSFVILDHAVLFPFGSELLVLDKQTGSVLGRVGDVRTGYAELREQETRNGSLNLYGNELFAGTANGQYYRFSAAKLDQIAVAAAGRQE